MLQKAALYLGFHCKPKYLFIGIQNGKGLTDQSLPPA